MPETIPTIWAALAWLISTLVQAASVGWIFRGAKASMKEASDDAKDAVAQAREAIQLARIIRDTDLLGIRKSITDVEFDLGLHGAALTQIKVEHEQIKKVVLEDLPTVVEGAIRRASEVASKAVWSRRRR